MERLLSVLKGEAKRAFKGQVQMVLSIQLF